VFSTYSEQHENKTTVATQMLLFALSVINMLTSLEKKGRGGKSMIQANFIVKEKQ
jgi:hypothetical protein